MAIKYPLVILFLVPATISQAEYTQEFFNGTLNTIKHLITPKCYKKFQLFVSNLNTTDYSWAMQMLDGTPNLPVGSPTLNFYDLGDFDKCIDVKTKSDNLRINGKYCLGKVYFTNGTKLRISDSISFATPLWALCLPDGCSTTDTNIIGNVMLHSLLEDEGVHVVFSDLLCQTVKQVKPELTPAALLTIVVAGLLFTIVLSCTLYDIYSKFYTTRSCYPIMNAFSLYTNSKSVFKLGKPSSHRFSCLDGLRCICTMWIIAFHLNSASTILAPKHTSSVIDWLEQLQSFFIISGYLAIETFLTIGGTLMSYSFMKNREKKTPFNLFKFYIHRYLRLSSTLAVVVLVSATLLTYTGSGPMWPYYIYTFQRSCEEYWWSTLLYVENYVNPLEMCVGQAWYTSVDMQLYFFSPLFFFLLWKYPKLGFTILGSCSALSIGASFHTIWRNSLPGFSFDFGVKQSKKNEFLKTFYFPTHTRATSWMIGVIVGYVVFKINHKQTGLRINKYVQFCMWLICLGTMLSCILGMSTIFLVKIYDVWSNASYAAFAHPAWSLATAWIILTCTTNNGGVVNWFLSLPCFQLFNRFTYGIYLTHVLVVYGLIYGRKISVDFDQFETALQFLGILCFSGCLSIVITLFVECPVLELEKFLLGYEKDKTKSDSGPNGGTTLSFELETEVNSIDEVYCKPSEHRQSR